MYLVCKIVLYFPILYPQCREFDLSLTRIQNQRNIPTISLSDFTQTNV